MTWWTWVWVSSRRWWWTGKAGVLQSMGSQRVRHDWATELNCVHCITKQRMFGNLQIFPILRGTFGNDWDRYMEGTLITCPPDTSGCCGALKGFRGTTRSKRSHWGCLRQSKRTEVYGAWQAAHTDVCTALASCVLNNLPLIAPSTLPDVRQHVPDSRHSLGSSRKRCPGSSSPPGAHWERSPSTIPNMLDEVRFSGEDGEALQEVFPPHFIHLPFDVRPKQKPTDGLLVSSFSSRCAFLCIGLPRQGVPSTISALFGKGAHLAIHSQSGQETPPATGTWCQNPPSTS